MQQENFDQLIAQLEQQTNVSELDFASSIPLIGPLIAALRRGWNNVSTRWVLRHYAQQQLEFQRTLIGLLREMQHAQAILQQSRTLMQQQNNEASARLITLEQANTRNQTLHETFNRDLEMLATHCLRQSVSPLQE